MKTKIFAVLIVALLSGCGDELPVYKPRTYKITAIGISGEPIVWTNAGQPCRYYGGCFFLNSAGKEIIISGNYVSEVE